MAYVGIDPGKQGAIVRIAGNGRVQMWVMPLRKDGSIDLVALCDIVHPFWKDKVALELVHAIHGTSKGSMFTMGRVLGNIEAALYCNSVDFTYVRPANWQARMWSEEDMVRVRSKSGKRMVNNTKATSLNSARRQFPNVDMRYGRNENRSKGRERTNEHDGIVDALLIAQYCKLWT